MKKLLTLFCILSSTTVWAFTNYTFGHAVFTGPTWHEEAANFVEINSGRFAGEELEISGTGWWVIAHSGGLAWSGRPASGDGSGIYNVGYSNLVKREWVYTGGQLAAHVAISSPQGWFLNTDAGFYDYFNMSAARVIHTSSGGVAIALPPSVRNVEATMICCKGANANSNVGGGNVVFSFWTRSVTNYPDGWQASGPAVNHYSGYLEITNTISAAFPWMWSVVTTNTFVPSSGPKFLIIQRMNSRDTYKTNVFVLSLTLREL